MVERAKRQDCRDPDGFCKQVDFLLDRYCRTALQGTKLRQVRIGEYLARMLAIACYYRVELDPSFVAVSSDVSIRTQLPLSALLFCFS